MTPVKMPDDTRACLLCGQIGDGVADGPSRLLNYDVDKWVHLNCALWSNVAEPGVYETVSGALMNVEKALEFAGKLYSSWKHKTEKHNLITRPKIIHLIPK